MRGNGWGGVEYAAADVRSTRTVEGAGAGSLHPLGELQLPLPRRFKLASTCHVASRGNGVHTTRHKQDSRGE